MVDRLIGVMLWWRCRRNGHRPLAVGYGCLCGWR